MKRSVNLALVLGLGLVLILGLYFVIPQVKESRAAVIKQESCGRVDCKETGPHFNDVGGPADWTHEQVRCVCRYYTPEEWEARYCALEEAGPPTEEERQIWRDCGVDVPEEDQEGPPGNLLWGTVTGAGQGGGPQVRVFAYSEREGRFINPTNFFAFDENFRGGVRLATGMDEQFIVVGAGQGGGPQVRIFDGKGTPIHSWFAFDPNFHGGVDVAVGHVGEDRKPAVAVSQFSQGQAWVKVFGFGDKDGKPYEYIIGEWNAYGSFEGGCTVAMADVDGDGEDEVITGAGKGGGPQVRVFEANGKPKMDFWPFHPDFKGGVDVSAGDVDGDGGKAEIAMSQRTDGEAWIKIYRYNKARDILAEFRAYPAGVECGANISLKPFGREGAGLSVGAGKNGGSYPLRSFAITKVKGAIEVNPSFNYYAYPATFRGGMTVDAGMFPR